LSSPASSLLPAAAAADKKTSTSRPLELLRWITAKARGSARGKDKLNLTSVGSSTCPVFATGNGIHDDEDASKPGYLDDSFVQQRIVDVADMESLVLLPSGVDLNEWLASHTVSFFEHINIIYGCVSEQCCQSTLCSTMSGPLNVQYQWVDERGKRTKCTASQYIDYVMSYSHQLIYDETVFPTKYGNVFMGSFKSVVKKINQFLLHVIAHIYHCHWRHLLTVGLHGHLNTLTYHFFSFCQHFSLVDEKDLEVLGHVYSRLQHFQQSAVVTSSTDVRLPVSADVIATASDCWNVVDSELCGSMLGVELTPQLTSPDSICLNGLGEPLTIVM
jgi:hypothetical protein